MLSRARRRAYECCRIFQECKGKVSPLHVVINAQDFSSIRPPCKKCNSFRSFSSSALATDGSEKIVHSSKLEAEKRDVFLVQKYKEMARDKNVMIDEHQIIALKELDRLRNDILASSIYTNEQSESFIGDDEEEDNTLFPFMKKLNTLLGKNSPDKLFHKNDIPNGVYLHGGVGCGKTFCMNLFFDELPIASKQKVHFHKFMLDIHKQMHETKMIDGVEGDVLPVVIEKVIENGVIIAFDEFQVTDVADALILRRLFTGLLDRGAVMVSTSNRDPNDLYLNGLQRDLFLPFIDLLKERNNVISMWDSDTDYRLVQGANKARGVYFIGDEGKKDFDESFKALTKESVTGSTALTAQGRNIIIPNASIEYKVARFSFQDLCARPTGAADYLLIGESFHTVFIEDIPELTMNDVNLVRRFITLIDSLYECHVKLIIHAKTAPEGIFKVDLDNQHCDEAFAFDRTQSRLQEMGSDEYLKSRWIGTTSSGDRKSEKVQKGMRVVLDDRDMQR